jgi:hypothetical protein
MAAARVLRWYMLGLGRHKGDARPPKEGKHGDEVAFYQVEGGRY